MDRIEYKRGRILVGGQAAGEQTKAVVAVLQAYAGADTKTTCDFINQLLQSLDTIVEKVKQLAEWLAEIFTDASKDICDSGERRRTRHGRGIKAGKLIQATANIKWREKYRPP